MLSYCLKRRKNTDIKNPKFVRTKNEKIMILSKCVIFTNLNQILLKNKKLMWIIKLFRNKHSIKQIFFIRSSFIIMQGIKMNKIVNKFLLAADKFIPQMQLRQTGLTYSACEPIAKKQKNLKKNEIQDR